MAALSLASPPLRRSGRGRGEGTQLRAEGLHPVLSDPSRCRASQPKPNEPERPDDGDRELDGGAAETQDRAEPRARRADLKAGEREYQSEIEGQRDDKVGGAQRGRLPADRTVRPEKL